MWVYTGKVSILNNGPNFRRPEIMLMVSLFRVIVVHNEQVNDLISMQYFKPKIFFDAWENVQIDSTF